MYLITYVSFRQFFDKEYYNNLAEAERRFAQLKRSKIVSHLKMREINKIK